MPSLRSALWAETLKAIRSKVPYFVAAGFCLMPAVGGFFMVILKDPAAARSMGLISAKAELTVGNADWPAYFGMLSQATAIGGAFLFSILTAWVFGREFSDRTVKELLALPTARSAIVSAKFIVLVIACCLITVLVTGLGLLVGRLVDVPGWSPALQQAALVDIAGAALLTMALLPFVAWIASAARGYLAAFGWVFLTILLAQVSGFTGWGDWFPWAVPALFSGAAGPRQALLGWHSYIVVAAACLVGLVITYWWWRDADQAR